MATTNSKDNIGSVAGKRHFIRTLCDSVRDELLSKAVYMPDEWDGLEIRELLSEKFDAQRSGWLQGRHADVKRRRKYRNERLTLNL